MSPTSPSLSNAVRDILNIRRADFFVSYGMGPDSRTIVDDLREVADVSAGIALDGKEYECCGNLRTMIYKGIREFGAKNLFDKVYCNYAEFPKKYRNIIKVFQHCYDLCIEKGMVLISGVSNQEAMRELLEAKNINKYWFLREKENQFDLLYKKEDHIDG